MKRVHHDEDLRERARQAICAVADALIREPESNGLRIPANKEGVFAGLLPAYVDAAGLFPGGADACARLIDRWIDVVEKQRLPGLFAGWAGIGWMTAHLDVEDDFVSEHVERFLASALQDWPARQGYDLITGLVGTGVFFVERLPAERSAIGLGLLLDALHEIAVDADGGATTWFTSPEHLPRWQQERAPNGYFNLGVAHGVPGVCWVLGKLCAEGIQVDRAATLLRRALRWVRLQQPNPWIAELPSWIAPGIDRVPNRRIAWCYGPLGAAAVTLAAARTIRDRESADWAHTLALACAEVAPEDAQIMDGGLCHGAAGNAQVFQRLYLNTGDARFRAAAHKWLRTTLNYRRLGKGIGGYQMWGDLGGNRQGWVDDASFLSGSSGVGLALLGAVTDVEPTWDRLMLLS